jgi:hypothetical protein
MHPMALTTKPLFPVLFTLLLLCAGRAAADTTTVVSEAQLVLSNLPEDAEITVNGLPKEPTEEGSITVEPGLILLELRQNRVVVYSALFSLDVGEKKFIAFECSEDCALLHIISEPSGATVSMNGEVLGYTPYLSRFYKPGSYSIMITHPGHIPVIRRVELSNDSSPLFSYQMEQTQAVKDSISAVRKAMRRKRQAIQSSLFGGAGLAMAAAGGWFEWRAYSHLLEAQRASDAYDAAQSHDECQVIKREYDKHRENARQPILYRNILYGVAGICIAGLYISFLF